MPHCEWSVCRSRRRRGEARARVVGLPLACLLREAPKRGARAKESEGPCVESYDWEPANRLPNAQKAKNRRLASVLYAAR